MSAADDNVGTVRRSKGGFAHWIKIEQLPGDPCWECFDSYGLITGLCPELLRTNEQMDKADDSVVVYSPVPTNDWRAKYEPKRRVPVDLTFFPEDWEEETGHSVTIAGITLKNVHERNAICEKGCVIHNPTEHHMSKWKLHYRADRNIFERICDHGIGHPDPDQFPYWKATDQSYEAVHGCDGCCRRETE